MIQLSAIATAVFGQWHPAGDLALPRIGMPAFDALAASVLRGQRAGGARAIDDRQRQLFAARGGHAQFQGSRAALAQPLMSHATARPRHAGTSFESQASQGADSGCESQASRTSRRYEPGSLPSRTGPQRLPTIERDLCAPLKTSTDHVA